MSLSCQFSVGEVKNRLQHLLETKELSDCSFLVGKGTVQLIKGHKAIVSAASPVLQKKITAAEGDHPKITLAEVEPQIFESILKYIYTDCVDIKPDTVYDLAEAAKIYQLPGLSKPCNEYIATNLNPHNVLRAYSIATQCSEDEDLKKKCEEIIRTKTKEVLTDTSFKEACLEVVVAVFSLESLEIDSELALLNAVDGYAKNTLNCNTHGSTLTIKNVLEKIRFLSLSPEEFARGRATTSVLSASDACAIQANIPYEKSGVPMPPGFSLRRDPRKKVNVTAVVSLSEIKFKLRVLDIENMLNKNESLWSPIFMLPDLKWKIEVVKKPVYLGIYANCNWEKTDSWSCNAEVEFSLLRTKGDPTSYKFTHNFKRGQSSWGFAGFIEISKIMDPNNHYIKDGGITFQIHIKTDEPQGM